MSRSTRIGRFIAAAALAVAATAVFAGSPAGAANTNISVDCSTSNYRPSIGNGDTLTISITGSACNGYIILDNPGSGALGSATLNGTFPLTAGTPIGLTGPATVVYTAPASGSGTQGLTIVPSLVAPITPTSSINITFPVPTPRTDTLVDNGNGSMTATFEPTTGSASIFINLFPSGTTCPSSGQPTGRLYVLSSSSQVPTPLVSPAVIAAGTTAYTVSNGSVSSTTIAAGSYQACMYYNPGNSGSTLLEQSLAVTLSELVAPDPVAPAFTG